MFGFIKKSVYCSNDFFWLQYIKVNPLKSVSTNNQECKVRPKTINIDSNEPFFPVHC